MTHHQPDHLDPRLAEAFAALRAESAEPARPEAVAAARRAMHLAAAERGGRGSLALAADRVRRALTLHRLVAATAGAAAVLGAVSAMGWNAPAGAPLHVVQVAREQITLAVPGIDRVSLDLAYAEAQLAQAAGGQAGDAALGEAQGLLDDARAHLPGDRSDPAWRRWQDDSRRLAGLRAAEQGEDRGASSASDGPAATSTPSAGDGRGGETTTTTSTSSAARTGGDGGGGSSSTSSTSSRSTTASGSDGGSGGSDGGHDGSQSSSSTSTSTSASSDGGH
jgi:hypothetical protein